VSQFTSVTLVHSDSILDPAIESIKKVRIQEKFTCVAMTAACLLSLNGQKPWLIAKRSTKRFQSVQIAESLNSKVKLPFGNTSAVTVVLRMRLKFVQSAERTSCLGEA
jgi:hypothetical protein